MRHEPLLDIGHDGLLSLLALAFLGGPELLHLGLGGADGEAFLKDEPGDQQAVRSFGDTEQGLGVAGGQLALAEVALDLGLQREQADAVRDGRARLAQAVGDGFLREAEVTHERGEAEGLVDGIEVGALEVLDEGEHGARSVGGLEDAGGDGRLAEQLERAEAPLAGDELIPFFRLADDDGLHEPFGTDGVGELLHLGGVEISAWLTRIRDDQGQRQFLQQEAWRDRRGSGSRSGSGGRLGGFHASADEGTETATEGFLGRSGHDFA